MREYHIGQTVVPYEIDWSLERSTIGLRMNDSMELCVRAPMEASLDDIEEALAEKKQWILKTIYGFAEQADTPGKKEFLSGEKLQYRGRQYRLNVAESDVPEPQLSFDGNQFTLGVHRFDAPGDSVSVRRKRQAVVDWYIQRAGEELPERVDRFAPKLGTQYDSVEVTEIEDRWGEYEDGTIRLNWRLILSPIRIQDYVVVHELAHAIHDRHSNSFWNTVGTLIPDYEDRREWLRLNGNTLTV
ncbi:M48 family metallopeptidase [Haloarcula onubensis]|uniref:M48 family metallopeptidase n=1 Tax=Haloarcula onubensis TaxID=2950539 RepID=A0ABU2FTA5_9EURY|nr:SprT family zinc-dependent metalloprotease [Halomicroarcula sp. S3CR25-11]MDS0283492.1 M48 family metallopeptidase [Halomicroarcula sp. S3CR25-11]